MKLSRLLLGVLLITSCGKCGTSDKTSENKSDRITVSSVEDTLPENPVDKNFFISAPAHVVPANTTDTITDPVITFSVLRMGDNSKLIIDNGIDSCQVNIKTCFIGDNCEIYVVGSKGGAGDKGADLGDDNDHGKDGTPGPTGGNGKTGGDGKYLQVNIGLNKLGKLTIDSYGGTGGVGGNGGKGQRGGNAQRFIHSGGNGGSGGSGGIGGSGGTGGKVVVNYWFNDSPLDVEGKFTVRSDGGVGGGGGEGGPGGGGGSAVSSGFTGKRSGGSPAPSGSKGAAGPSGAHGPFPKVTQVRKT